MSVITYDENTNKTLYRSKTARRNFHSVFGSDGTLYHQETSIYLTL